jgi:hypothetical protein
VTMTSRTRIGRAACFMGTTDIGVVAQRVTNTATIL